MLDNSILNAYVQLAGMDDYGYEALDAGSKIWNKYGPNAGWEIEAIIAQLDENEKEQFANELEEALSEAV